MIYLFLSRSIGWPMNLFGFTSNNQQGSILDDDYQKKTSLDQSPPLISNKDLSINSEQSKNMNEAASLISLDKYPQLPSASTLSALGKHYLTREDLEKLIQARFQQETPRDRVERLLWRE